jgi:hypothetical protein
MKDKIIPAGDGHYTIGGSRNYPLFLLEQPSEGSNEAD